MPDEAINKLTIYKLANVALKSIRDNASNFGVSSTMMKTMDKLGPDSGWTAGPLQAIDKARELSKLASGQIQASIAIDANPQAAFEVKKRAQASVIGWQRVLDSLPTMPEMDKTYAACKSGNCPGFVGMEAIVTGGKAGVKTATMAASAVAGADADIIRRAPKMTEAEAVQVYPLVKTKEGLKAIQQRLEAISRTPDQPGSVIPRKPQAPAPRPNRDLVPAPQQPVINE